MSCRSDLMEIKFGNLDEYFMKYCSSRKYCMAKNSDKGSIDELMKPWLTPRQLYLVEMFGREDFDES